MAITNDDAHRIAREQGVSGPLYLIGVCPEFG